MLTTVLSGGEFHKNAKDRIVLRQGLHDGTVELPELVRLDNLVAKNKFNYNGFDGDVKHVRDCLASGLWATPSIAQFQFKEHLQIMRNKQVKTPPPPPPLRTATSHRHFAPPPPPLLLRTTTTTTTAATAAAAAAAAAATATIYHLQLTPSFPPPWCTPT